MRRSAPTRRSTPATPAAAPTRSAPTAPSAGSIRPATRSGPPPPSAPPAPPTGARSTSTPSPSTPPDSRSGAAPSPATSPPRRRSAATAPSTSAPSTASSTPSTPTPAPIAGASPPPSTSTAPRRWAADAQGKTTAIYIGSADGSIYALRPDGSLLWRYDTGDPIRSSPVVGRTPNGEGEIVYVGSSNGKLYAIDAASGRRRWSFDTTPPSGPLRDRNDLNGSPALGRHGIYIGGEHGYLAYVPYDYCLHRRDPRCERSPAQEFGSSVDRVFFVTPGGTTRAPARRKGAGGDGARHPPDRPPRRGHEERQDGRAGLRRARPRHPQLPLPHPALRRRAVPLHPPRWPAAGGDEVSAAGRRRLGGDAGDGQLRHDDRLPHRAGRRAAAAGGWPPPRQRAEDQPPGAAAALAAAERQPDRLRQLRPDRRHPAQDQAEPQWGGEDPDVGGRGRGAPAAGPSPIRAATSPSRSRAPTAATR